MQGAWAARPVHAGDRAFAETNIHAAGAEQRSQKRCQIRIVPHDENGLIFRDLFQQLFKVGNGCARRKSFRRHDFAVVAGFRSHQRRRLQCPFERARDDHVKVNLERIQVVAHQNALLLALFIKRAFDVDEGIGAPCSGTGMTKNIQIHVVDSIRSGN